MFEPPNPGTTPIKLILNIVSAILGVVYLLTIFHHRGGTWLVGPLHRKANKILARWFQGVLLRSLTASFLGDVSPQRKKETAKDDHFSGFFFRLWS